MIHLIALNELVQVVGDPEPNIALIASEQPMKENTVAGEHGAWEVVDSLLMEVSQPLLIYNTIWQNSNILIRFNPEFIRHVRLVHNLVGYVVTLSEATNLLP